MSTELNLRFPDIKQVIVSLLGGRTIRSTGILPFESPITKEDQEEFRWYFETYATSYTAEPDDDRAAKVVDRIAKCGQSLHAAVFTDQSAHDLFHVFAKDKKAGRLLSVSAELPDILALPWELLHRTDKGAGFVFQHQPAISICRRFEGSKGTVDPFIPKPKKTLRILFIVSRPEDASFIDPRAEAEAVMDAVEESMQGRVGVEFLRPPTFEGLLQRLSREPAVDVIHFDGHGIYRMPDSSTASKKVNLDKASVFPDSALLKRADGRVGHLLFEDPESKKHEVAADLLGQLFFSQEIPLVVLSACQSAKLGASDEPMGCTAARLISAGIPTVIAMTHSVLVQTTHKLFGEFYRGLGQGLGVGASLDAARWSLFADPRKHEVRRSSGYVPLKLHDWFLPALYQSGTDVTLLKKTKKESPKPESDSRFTNIPKPPETGFFGRKRKLWEIERWFAGPTRRITITGFGGQGKTALALEAGRWLTRTGLFQAAVFVDYSHIQASDAVAVAVSNIGSVLGVSLIDAAAATSTLKQTHTLVILDNLEALEPESLRALLDAAVPWSEAGCSRVLCTTRRPQFGHAAYRVEGTLLHRRIQLDGLGSRQAPDDALEWCAALMKLPPAPSVPAPRREALIELFDRVKFHPLSIRVLAQQLKTRRSAELGERLEQLLAIPHTATPASTNEDTPAGLIASLELSLDRLDDAARNALPRLGVFQGGAFEDNLIAITGLGDPRAEEREQIESFLAAVEAGKAQEFFQAMEKPAPNESELRELVTSLREQLAQIPPPVANLWPGLRRQLEAAALIEAEEIPGIGVPFLRFHPTLAPMLRAQLEAEERNRLGAAHRRRYYALSGYLYNEDNRNPHQVRAIAWRELPNLLHAVHAALDAGDPDAVDFSNNVNLFLDFFGLKQEAEILSAKVQSVVYEVGSRAWYLAQTNRGEQLRQAGQVTEAAQVFQTILKTLGASASNERAITLGNLGRCFRAAGRPDLAVRSANEAIEVCDKLDSSDVVKRLRGACLTDLADGFMVQGKYAAAREAYQDGLKVDEELNDLRGQGVTLAQLGTLAMLEGNLSEAADQYRAALALFQQLREPATEAAAWHQLGMVFEEARQWDEAERHYRESARIEEERGNLTGAAQTWNQLANVSIKADKPGPAERWYRKAIEDFRAIDDEVSLSVCLCNLAILLHTQSGRLAEARQLAEEALIIKQTLDTGAVEIWKSYNILAKIGEQEVQATTDARQKEKLQAQARDHRRLARENRFNFAGTRHELLRNAHLILGAVMAVQDSEQRKKFEGAFPNFEQNGWTLLVAAIRQILAGERDADNLCANLDHEDSMIIEAILQGLVDPSTLDYLLPPEADETA